MIKYNKIQMLKIERLEPNNDNTFFYKSDNIQTYLKSAGNICSLGLLSINQPHIV